MHTYSQNDDTRDPLQSKSSKERDTKGCESKGRDFGRGHFERERANSEIIRKPTQYDLAQVFISKSYRQDARSSLSKAYHRRPVPVAAVSWIDQDEIA